MNRKASLAGWLRNRQVFAPRFRGGCASRYRLGYWIGSVKM